MRKSIFESPFVFNDFYLRSVKIVLANDIELYKNLRKKKEFFVSKKNFMGIFFFRGISKYYYRKLDEMGIFFALGEQIY